MGPFIEKSDKPPESAGEGTLKVWSISELTRRIRSTIERVVGYVWVEGEISNLLYHPSGHIYFTLKDAQSQLSAVMFRGEAVRLGFRLKDGQQVQGAGRITVYERRGNYQIILDTMKPAGMGDLQAAFMALKRKLDDEGLFDPARKRSLPIFPRTVGVVTSPSGAAIRDFCRVLHRRFPGVRIVISPCAVQGQGAGQEIAAAVDLLNLVGAGGLDLEVDVIAIIRGGGSMEDLWAFNEEVVARAVARSKIPTISGVGHEVDFTICDFVADIRAPTPSAAAEMLIRPKAEFASEVNALVRALHRGARLAFGGWRHRLAEAREKLHLREPRQFLREWRMRLDDAMSDIRRNAHQTLRHSRERWLEASRGLSRQHPLRVVTAKRARLQQVNERWIRHQSDYFHRLRGRLDRASGRLEILNPLATLSRGYSITMEAKSGKVVRSIAMAKNGERWITRFADGRVESRVTTIHSERPETNDKP